MPLNADTCVITDARKNTALVLDYAIAPPEIGLRALNKLGDMSQREPRQGRAGHKRWELIIAFASYLGSCGKH